MSDAVLAADARAEQAFGLPPADARRAVRDAAREGGADYLAAVLTRATALLRRDPRLAFWTSNAAARRADVLGLETTAARGLRIAAGALLNLGRPRLALTMYDRALLRLDREGDPEDVAAIEVKRIHPLTLLGRHGDALAAARAARRIREAMGNQLGLAEIEIALGDQCYRLDRAREALRHYTIARGHLAPDRYGRLRAILDCNSANCLEALHRWGAAQRLFERARAAFERDGLHQTVAQVDHNRAYFAFVRGRYDEALRLYDASEATFESLGDQREVATVALERAEVLLQMGMAADARAGAAAAAERFGRAGLSKERAQSLLVLAIADVVEGGGEAPAALTEARDAFVAEGSVLRVAECDLIRAACAESRGDAPTARRLAVRAQEEFLRERALVRAGSADLLVARLDVAAGRAGDALARIDRAQERLGDVAGPWLEVELHRARGLAHLAAGSAGAASDAFTRATAALDAHRGAVPADEFMVAFLASRAAIFREAVEAHLAAGRIAAAFDASERAHARALTDRIASRRAEGPREPSISDMRIQRLREELNAVYSRIHRSGAAGPPSAESDAAMRIDAGRREAVLARLLRRRTEARASGGTSDGVRAALDATTTIVEYCAARDGLHAFVVTRDAVRHVALGVDESWVADRVQRFRFHLAKFEVSDDLGASGLSLRATRANLAEIADRIMGPVRDLVRTPRLVVVPHGALHSVPFHALPDGEGWLSDAFDVVHAPSAAVYAHCATRRPAADGPATVLALPDDVAPMIADEAASVARSLGAATRVLTGSEATSAALRAAAPASRVLHLATHGMFRADTPTMSCLRLADTWLNLHDVCELDVQGGLVVLSACESGVAAVTAAGDPMGLLRGFLVAGAPCVVASLWRVSDRASALFMDVFYASLASTGDPESSARRARAEVRRQHPHPYHWAAFAIFGHGVRVRAEQTVLSSPVRRAGADAEPRRTPCVSLS